MSDLSIAREMKRQLAEKEFEALVKKYILDVGSNSFGDGRHFQFGGALNLISTVRAAFADLAEETGCIDYMTVAEKLAAVEAEADLAYWHPSEAA